MGYTTPTIVKTMKSATPMDSIRRMVRKHEREVAAKARKDRPHRGGAQERRRLQIERGFIKTNVPEEEG